MGVCPRLELIILCLILAWGMTFIFMVHLRFDAISLLIYESCMISLQYLRVPSYDHFLSTGHIM